MGLWNINQLNNYKEWNRMIWAFLLGIVIGAGLTLACVDLYIALK